MPASNYRPQPATKTRRLVTSKMRQVSPDGMSNGMTAEIGGGACGRGSYLRRNVITSHLKYPIFY